MSKIMLLDQPRTSQPQNAITRLSADFSGASNALVALPGVSPQKPISGIGTLSFSQSNTSTTPRYLGNGVRLVADQGGSNDDRFAYSESLPTNRVTSVTTIIVFDHIDSGNDSYNFCDLSGSGQIISGVARGYFGSSGYNAYHTYNITRALRNGKTEVCVLSIDIERKQIYSSVRIGNTLVAPTGFTGDLSYIGGGSIGSTWAPWLGTADFPNYYHPDGVLRLWAILPGVVCKNVDAISANPWQIFANEQIPIFIPDASTGAPTLSALTASLITSTGCRATVQVAR